MASKTENAAVFLRETSQSAQMRRVAENAQRRDKIVNGCWEHLLSTVNTLPPDDLHAPMKASVCIEDMDECFFRTLGASGMSIRRTFMGFQPEAPVNVEIKVNAGRPQLGYPLTLSVTLQRIA
jgi:hypothetical protein